MADAAPAGFDPSWLRLRESYDHAARDPGLVRALDRALAGAPRRILDLAGGTGSNFRYLAPRLTGAQDWLLLDHDPVLLDRIGPELLGWDPRVTLSPGAAALGARRLRWARADLRAGLDLDGCWDAVTTSALLDLVSQTWLVALADWCAARRLPLLAALSVDGRVRWDPGDPRDDAVQSWFRDHQRTDRGFGASPGPAAAAVLGELLEARGYAISLAPADWQIDTAGHGPRMLEQMIDGVAAASAEVSDDPPLVARWRQVRRAQAAAGELALTVGHQDLLALP